MVERVEFDIDVTVCSEPPNTRARLYSMQAVDKHIKQKYIYVYDTVYLFIIHRFVHGILTRIDPSLGPVDERDHDGSTIYGRWFDAETAAFNVNE
eukprot:scaffold19606_cov134-Skeletonema_marinoi.AAC.2